MSEFYDPNSSIADGKTASATELQAEFNEVGAAFDAVEEAFGKTLRFADPVGEITATLVQRAAKLFAFDQAGAFQLLDYLGTWKGDWAASTAYPLYSLVRAPESHFESIYIVTTQHTSTANFADNLANMAVFYDNTAAFRRAKSILTAGSYSAVLGDVLFCDVTAGNVTINLPTTGLSADTPPITITHLAGTIDATHKIIVNPGAGQKIMTGTNGETMEVTDTFASLCLEYLNSTYGWRLRML